VAHDAAARSFETVNRHYAAEWLRYDARLRRPASTTPAGMRAYYESVNVVKASEDKTFPGAIAAGMASPWGQAVPARNSTNGNPTHFGSYREVCARDLGNGSITTDQRSIIDQGFLELVRLGVLPATDPIVCALLTIVDQVIKRTTPSGPGFYRYGTSAPGSEDGYGDCYEPDPTNCHPSGAPWPTTDTGSGHLWHVLGGERGEYAIASGDRTTAEIFLQAMLRVTSGQGLEPEQVWEDPPLAPSPFGSDSTTASIGFAPPAGGLGESAHLGAGAVRPAGIVPECRAQPRNARDRYRSPRQPRHARRPGKLPLTVTSPANGSRVTGSSVDVAGTTLPGARVDAAAAGAAGAAGGTASATADASGNWRLSLPVGLRSTTITVTATSGRCTGYGQLTVINVSLPGTTVLPAADPSGDDNGPGTSRIRPTRRSSSARPICWACRSTRPRPTSASKSRSATSHGRPVGRLARVGAADRRPTERHGHAGAAPVGDRQRYLGLGVHRRADRAGWLQPDQARGFAPTPQPFLFGVCATSSNSNPICKVPPGSEPKVIDTMPPPGVSQDGTSSSGES
jgi:glucoamylase